MTNFLVAYTFWAKVALFLFFLGLEPRLSELGGRWLSGLKSSAGRRVIGQRGQHD